MLSVHRPHLPESSRLRPNRQPHSTIQGKPEPHQNHRRYRREVQDSADIRNRLRTVRLLFHRPGLQIRIPEHLQPRHNKIQILQTASMKDHLFPCR